MKQTNERFHLRRLIIIGLVFLFFLAGLSFYRYSTIRRQSDLSMQQKLLGTWVGEEGNIVALRSDGTARSRIPETKGVQFFEWTTSRNELKLFLGKPSYGREFTRYVLGGSSLSMEIMDVSDDQLVLLDHSSGHRSVLTKTNDTILDEAK